MRRFARVAAALLMVLCLGAVGPAGAEEDVAKEIGWIRDVAQGFERAAAEERVLMICINAKHAEGEPDEPAAKALREVVYRDPKVVEAAASFVCVFLTRGGSSSDFGELRARFGIDGAIVSPQHIFARPGHEEGDAPLLREAYWRHGGGEEAVKAMLALMARATEAWRVQQGVPESPPDAKDPAARAAWIRTLVEIVKGGDAGMRQTALRALLAHDAEGDTTAPLIALVGALEDDADREARVAIVRALGVPGLTKAADALHGLLAHKDDVLRGNAVVSLEYIGCPASTKPLLDRLRREKDAPILNHVCRALGRCGAGDKKAKKNLRMVDPEKDGDAATFGPLIGLSYAAGDERVARALEKRLRAMGSPFQMGSKAHDTPRALMVWCLAMIRDPKSAGFLRKTMIAPYAEDDSPDWRRKHTLGWYEAVARWCAGDDESRRAAEAGVRNAMWSEEARALVDAYRRGRGMARFQPHGEWGNEPKDD